MLKWVAISFSRGSSWPRDWTYISCIAGGFFTTEPLRKPNSFSESLLFVYPPNDFYNLMTTFTTFAHSILFFIKYSFFWINIILALWILSFNNFPCGSAGKESTCNVGDLGSIPGLGRSTEEGKGYLLQYSGLENSMDTVHGVTKSWTWLSDFQLTSLHYLKISFK